MSAEKAPRLTIDWQNVADMARSGCYGPEISDAIGYRGNPRDLRQMAARRGIDIRVMTPQEAGRKGGLSRPSPQYPQQVTVAPSQVRDPMPDRGGKPMFTDRTADAIAGMRARGASDREIAQALKLTPTQASAYGLRAERASDPFRTDPRNKAKDSDVKP